MKYKEFLDQIKAMEKEVGGDGETKTGSHTYPPSLAVYCDDPEDDNSYEITDITPNTHLGCGCWTGIEIRIRKKKEGE